jgi:hypothetical protein
VKDFDGEWRLYRVTGSTESETDEADEPQQR